MSNYSEKLKDPRWQRKRLEVMQRDNFTCMICDSPDKTLHVHHKYYIKGREPWDYDDKILVTLCEDCHVLEEELKESSKKGIYEVFLDIGYTNYDLDWLIPELARVEYRSWRPLHREILAALHDPRMHELASIIASEKIVLIDDLPF